MPLKFQVKNCGKTKKAHKFEKLIEPDNLEIDFNNIIINIFVN